VLENHIVGELAHRGRLWPRAHTCAMCVTCSLGLLGAVQHGLEREAAFWKAELDKAIAERTLFAAKFLKVRPHTPLAGA
jgi:hypothetical protein